MKVCCKCGTVVVDIDSGGATIKCNNCDWRHTYLAFPRRVLEGMNELLTLMRKRKVRFEEGEE